MKNQLRKVSNKINYTQTVVIISSMLSIITMLGITGNMDADRVTSPTTYIFFAVFTAIAFISNWYMNLLQQRLYGIQERIQRKREIKRILEKEIEDYVL